MNKLIEMSEFYTSILFGRGVTICKKFSSIGLQATINFNLMNGTEKYFLLICIESDWY